MRKRDIIYLERVVKHYDDIYRLLNAVLEHSYSDDDVIIAEGFDRREIRVTELIRDMIVNVRVDRENVRRKKEYFKEFFKDDLV